MKQTPKEKAMKSTEDFREAFGCKMYNDKQMRDAIDIALKAQAEEFSKLLDEKIKESDNLQSAKIVLKETKKGWGRSYGF